MARKYSGRTIVSRDLVQQFEDKELTRRNLTRRQLIGAAGSMAGGMLVGCTVEEPVDDDGNQTPTPQPEPEPEPTPAPTYMVGMAAGENYDELLLAALAETIGRNGLEFVEAGQVVYLKVNANSGDPYPYSTNPRMVELLTQMCWERGASRVIVGDRSFWGDPNTMGNLNRNGMVAACSNAGAELVVFDDDEVDWVAFSETDAPDWLGGFRFPLPVVEADHIINLPCVKTHFISTFTMGMKNIIGLVNPTDRRRDGNLRFHSTQENKLYKQTAQLNQHVTPSLTILDGVKAVVRGGPNISGDPPGLVAEPGVIIASTDRIAADVTGLALLKLHAVEGEAVHDFGVWENPQIVEAVNAEVGIGGAEEYSAASEDYEQLDELKALIAG